MKRFLLQKRAPFSVAGIAISWVAGFEPGTPPFVMQLCACVDTPPPRGVELIPNKRPPRDANLQNMSSEARLGDVSLRETNLSEQSALLSGKTVPNNDRGCCRSPACGSLWECLKGEGERPSLPEPRRPSQPLSHGQYELQECLPCVFKPLHYFLLDRLPILGWLLQYNLRWMLADVVAGLTVGLMVVPQALAYAKIANLQLKVRL